MSYLVYDVWMDGHVLRVEMQEINLKLYIIHVSYTCSQTNCLSVAVLISVMRLAKK